MKTYTKKLCLSFVLCSVCTFINLNHCSAQWIQTLYKGAYVENMAVSNLNIFVATTGGGIYRSTNNGIDWTQTSLDSGFIKDIAANGNKIFVARGYEVYVSTNNGNNWSTALSNTFGQVTCFLINGSDIFAGTTSRVYRSTNNGINWVQTTQFGRNVLTLAISGSHIYAGTYQYGVYVTTNNGINWSQTSLNNQDILSLATIGSHIFAGTSLNGIYLSTNYGESWEPIGFNNECSIYSLAIQNSHVFASVGSISTMFGGVYLTTNNGVNWIVKNQGLDQTTNPMGPLLIANNYIFVGKQNIIWRRTYNEIINIKTISTEVPTEYNLSQNYPNPFNPSTTIEFSIKEKSNVTLKIFDVNGKKIETLVNNQLGIGSYKYDFNAQNLASGIYFYQLETNKFLDTKRMVLVK